MVGCGPFYIVDPRAMGKKKGNDDDSSKSYYIWIADDDAHVESAMKRLKAKPPLPRKKGPAAASSSTKRTCRFSPTCQASSRTRACIGG